MPSRRMSMAVAASLALVGSGEAFLQAPVIKGAHTRKFAQQASASRHAAPPLRMALSMPALAPLPSIEGALPDCPTTKWSSEGIDIRGEQAKCQSDGIPESLMTISATAEDNAKGLDYFVENKEMILNHMNKNGAVLFKNFDMSKDPEGFRRVWETLGLAPCLDPIHSSGLRSFLSARDGVYEEVNKQSLAGHYIGLHNESTFKKTATCGAFVCFSPASVKGGEFFIADGAKIFRDIKPEVLEDLYTRGVRISVSNLDLGFLSALGPLKENAMEAVKGLVDKAVAPKFDMDLDMIYGTDGNPGRLQAIEHKQSPINRHPESGRPVWFCNIHNHARYLRDRRLLRRPVQDPWRHPGAHQRRVQQAHPEPRDAVGRRAPDRQLPHAPWPPDLRGRSSARRLLVPQGRREGGDRSEPQPAQRPHQPVHQVSVSHV